MPYPCHWAPKVQVASLHYFIPLASSVADMEIKASLQLAEGYPQGLQVVSPAVSDLASRAFLPSIVVL